jgi:glycosyltransferase involved in cell wall biosynthesis
MGELLELGGQITCRDFHTLRSTVQELLANEDKRNELRQTGSLFARQFTYERFRAEWIDLVNNISTTQTSI